jgi:hypothetical protein
MGIEAPYHISYLLSLESTSSTVSQARRASTELAPNFLLISSASLTRPEVSALAASCVLLLTPNGAGAKAWAEAARRTMEKQNFMVVGVGVVLGEYCYECGELWMLLGVTLTSEFDGWMRHTSGSSDRCWCVSFEVFWRVEKE